MLNKSIFRLEIFLIENNIPFTFLYDKKENGIFWVQNKYIPYVKCRIKQNKDATFSFLSNFTRPKIISGGLTLEKAFEMAREHYNYEAGDDL